MRVGESAYTETIGRIQLALEKLTTNILYLSELQQASCRQQSLYVTLLHRDARRVAKVNQQLHGRLVNVSYRHFRLATLGQLASEHGVEVWRAGTENDAVREQFARADNEYDIAEFTVLAQHVDGF